LRAGVRVLKECAQGRTSIQRWRAYAAIEDLIRLGAIRSDVLVGGLCELIAARYYGVSLPSSFTPGYDLIDKRGNRVQVKTLRATPTRPRTIIGDVKDPCDVLLAIRLDFDYAPTEAIESRAPWQSCSSARTARSAGPPNSSHVRRCGTSLPTN
jgi:hypothetical protein